MLINPFFNMALGGFVLALIYQAFNNPAPTSSDKKILLSDNNLLKLKGPYRTLGQGQFGVVKEYQLQDNTACAVKIPTDIRFNQVQQNELDVLIKLNPHPHIIKLIASIEVDDHIWIIMELMQGTLYDLLTQSASSLSWKTKISLAQQLTAGIAHLHAHSIAHCDLNPANVLFNSPIKNKSSNIQLKITDFGSARNVTSDMVHSDSGTLSCLTPFGMVGSTYAYTAPELYSLLNGSPTNKGHSGLECDVYSLGLLFYVIMTGVLVNRTSDQILKGQFHFQSSFTNHPQLTHFENIIHECTSPNPIKRPSAVSVEKEVTEILRTSTNCTL